MASLRVMVFWSCTGARGTALIYLLTQIASIFFIPLTYHFLFWSKSRCGILGSTRKGFLSLLNSSRISYLFEVLIRRSNWDIPVHCAGVCESKDSLWHLCMVIKSWRAEIKRKSTISIGRYVKQTSSNRACHTIIDRGSHWKKFSEEAMLTG